ncbi:hypothetical protein JW906_14585 [bacterium]|nr:hypothetical protein [bacterium]
MRTVNGSMLCILFHDGEKLNACSIYPNFSWRARRFLLDLRAFCDAAALLKSTLKLKLPAARGGELQSDHELIFMPSPQHSIETGKALNPATDFSYRFAVLRMPFLNVLLRAPFARRIWGGYILGSIKENPSPDSSCLVQDSVTTGTIVPKTACGRSIRGGV